MPFVHFSPLPRSPPTQNHLHPDSLYVVRVVHVWLVGSFIPSALPPTPHPQETTFIPKQGRNKVHKNKLTGKKGRKKKGKGNAKGKEKGKGKRKRNTLEIDVTTNKASGT